jgi:tetratricopeptide (TPR) repeat protein
MAIYVYATDACREEARKHSVEPQLDRIIKKIESDQSYSQFQPFPYPFLVKKKFGIIGGRLIAQIEEVDGNVVLVLLALMLRGSKEYKDRGGFYNDPPKYAEQNFRSRFSPEELARFVAQKVQEPPMVSKPNLDEQERLILHDVLSISEGKMENSFCDGRAWTLAMSQKNIGNRKQSIHSYLEKLMESWDTSSPDAGAGGCVFALPNSNNLQVWTRLFPNLRIRLLVAVGTATEIKERIDEPTKEVINTPTPTKDQVLRISARLYPELVVLSYDLWAQLQDDEDSNLALSPEEEDVRRSVRIQEDEARNWGSRAMGFPLFINGRAGSGKTTILHYLFAEFAAYHTRRKEGRDSGLTPIYFTANPRLMQRAIENVTKIILCNFQINDKADDLNEEQRNQITAQTKEYFACFHEFLISCLPHTERNNFPANRRITYARFRELWREHFSRDKAAASKFGPAISWHVIRTYILGTETDFDDFESADKNSESVENILEPDDYRHHDRRSRTVTDETYKLVFDNVWPWYQEIKSEKNYWDDQQLVRYILGLDAKKRQSQEGKEGLQGWNLPTFSAVFCDESQDFTPVELSFLLKLSIYSHRKIQPHEVKFVPFVFAGDQFQTLNPTGFRWEAIKASYVEKIALGLDSSLLEEQRKVSLNYQELRYNYRSSSEIVGFCNLIQALRSRVFDLTSDIRPQQSWANENTSPVVVTSAERDDLWESVRKYQVKVIVPCGEDEEEDYIRNDPILSKQIHFDKQTGGTDITVLSAANAKGLEFSHVMVYGFAGAEEAKKVLSQLSDQTLEADQALPLQYFINKLYVAVSRPTERLVIAEQKTLVEQFWKFHFEGENLNAIKNGLRRWDEDWQPNIKLPFTDNAFLFSEGAATDPSLEAEKLKSQGTANRSPFTLRQAAKLYQLGDKKQEVSKCIALALEYEGKYKEAADEFFKADAYKEATTLYFRAGLWTHAGKILQCSKHEQKLEGEIATRLAQLSCSIQQKPAMALDKAGASLKIIQEHPEISSLTTDPELNVSFRDALDHIAQYYMSVSSADPHNWTTFVRPILVIRPMLGVLTESDHVALAKMAHRAKLWREGAEHFEKSKQTSSREYDECKAKSSQWPDNVGPLCRLKLFDDVRRPYLEKNRPPLAMIGNTSGFVAFAFASDEENCTEALHIMQQNEMLPEGILKVFNTYPKKKLNDRIRKALISRYFARLGQEKNVDTLLNILRDVEKFEINVKLETHIKDYIKANEKDVRTMCVLALASIADGWSKVEWGATSPHKKNRYIQELKRAYPVARLSTSDPFALALAFVYERLDEKFEALAILDKITTESNISSDLVKLAWRRWVKLHMKSFREETAKGNVSAANKALLTAKNGFYSAEVDDKSEENIPTDPTELDNKWYFEGIKDFGLSSPAMLESAGELYNKNVGAVTPTKETKPEPIQPIRPTTSNIQSSYRVLKIGDIVLTYVPGSKVNIDHAESRAAYRFDKKRAESLDDNFLSEDGLTIPSLNLTMKDLGNDRVRILISGSGFSIDFFKDAPAADVP